MRRNAALVAALLASLLLLPAGAQSPAQGESRGAAELAFAREGDLYAVAVDGSRTIRLSTTRAEEGEPAATRDGRRIAYTRGFAELWTMTADGRRTVRVMSSAAGVAGPAWSPDGRTIFLSRFFPHGIHGAVCGSIFRVGSDGRGLRRVTRSRGHSHEDPAVSPNARRIAFTDANACEGGTTSYALRVVDTSGRRTTDLARLPGNAYFPVHPEYEDPAWSPDGRRLAFVAHTRLGLANRDGSGVRRITPARLTVDDPAWSPDGNWIAFVGHDEAEGDIYVVRPDGTGLHRITRTAAHESSPAWLGRMPR